jgi:hypothetical protein
MPSTIELTDDALRFRSSGLIRLFLGQFELPYTEIESVEAGLHELPSMSFNMRFRVTKSKAARGRYRDGDGRWYLFDFRHRERAVMIITHPRPGFRYSVLGIEPDGDPEAFVAELRARL